MLSGGATITLAQALIASLGAIVAACALAASAMLVFRQLIRSNSDVADTKDLWGGGVRIAGFMLVIGALASYGPTMASQLATSMPALRGSVGTSLVPDNAAWQGAIASGQAVRATISEIAEHKAAERRRALEAQAAAMGTVSDAQSRQASLGNVQRAASSGNLLEASSAMSNLDMTNTSDYQEAAAAARAGVANRDTSRAGRSGTQGNDLMTTFDPNLVY